MDIVQGVQCKHLSVPCTQEPSSLFFFYPLVFLSANGLVDGSKKRTEATGKTLVREQGPGSSELCQRQRVNMVSSTQGLAVDPFVLDSSGS